MQRVWLVRPRLGNWQLFYDVKLKLWMCKQFYKLWPCLKAGVVLMLGLQSPEENKSSGLYSRKYVMRTECLCLE